MLHIIALFWAVCVSVATVGVQIHNCLCCDAPAPKIETKACCHKSATSDTAAKTCCSEHAGKPCPSHQDVLKQLKLEYLLAKTTHLKPHTFEAVSADEQVPFLVHFPIAYADTFQQITSNKAPPPRPFGQAMLRFNQVWRI